MKNKTPLLKRDGFQSLIASLICVVLGVLIGYIVLLVINPAGAGKAIMAVLKNFFFYPSHPARMKYFGTTLVKTAPLVMCSLSILFAYKVGLFNIGVAGQYVAGAGACLYAAIGLHWPWWACLLFAVACGALLGGISGVLKAYANVNEVISGIMLNWISLYLVNIILTNVKEPTSPYTIKLQAANPGAIMPSLGLNKLFGNGSYVTLGIPLAILIAIAIYIILERTKFGYELRATGNNKNAAKYAGMKEKQNIIVTLVIGGALAAMGAALLYLTDIEQWSCSQSSVPGMGFNGIAAAFLGCLNPIGALISSYFIQHITNGGGYVDKMFYSSQISDLISAIIIYLCGFVLFFKTYMNRLGAKREDQRWAPAKTSHGEVPAPADGPAPAGEPAPDAAEVPDEEARLFKAMESAADKSVTAGLFDAMESAADKSVTAGLFDAMEAAADKSVTAGLFDAMESAAQKAAASEDSVEPGPDAESPKGGDEA